jgi:hypothetical protein
MAHFAELDGNNIVLRVVVVNNSDITDPNGNESESIGQEFCHNLYGGRWIQTSYNSKFRIHFAGIGDTYNLEEDFFIPKKQYPSWIFNKEIKNWVPPIPYPEDELMYEWNEQTVSWKALTFEVTD